MKIPGSKMFGNRIKLEKDLYEKAKEIAKAGGYSSVDEFVNHLVEKEVSKLDGAKEEEEIKRRLQGLGYIS